MEYRHDMRWTILTSLAVGFIAASVPSHAVPAAQLKENYQSIIERNPFGLKDPPPPATNGPAEKPKPKTEIFLTGLTSIGYPKIPKQAYFFTREQGKKDPTYYSLKEGENQDGIQVLNIDTAQRKVRVKMNNSETLLSFDTHGVSATNIIAKPQIPSPQQAAMQYQPGHPGAQAIPLPGGNQATYGGGQPVYQNTGQPAVQQNVMNGAATRPIPTRRIRGGAATAVPQIGQPGMVGSSRVDLQACKLEYSIVSPK